MNNEKVIYSERYHHPSSQLSIIFSHGLFESCEYYDHLGIPNLKSLQNNFSFTRYDLQGHGNSSGVSTFTWQDYATDLATVIEDDPSTNIILCGWSIGAGIITHYLTTTPSERVKGVVLMGPPRGFTNRDVYAPKLHKYARLIREDGIDAFFSLMDSLPPNPFVKSYIPESIRIQRQVMPPIEFLPQLLSGSAESNFPTKQKLGKLETPCLILARADDPVHPEETAQEIHQVITHSQLKIAHNREEMEHWVEDIKEFCEELIQ